MNLSISRQNVLKALTLVGCFSTGIIYGSIGVIALLSLFKLKQGGADESSFFVLLNGSVAGQVLNWIIILGAVCFVIWRFYEAFNDPYHIGNDGKGILLRTGGAFSSGADAFIAFSALQAIFSETKTPVTGEPVEQRNLVAGLLTSGWGEVAVIITAVVIILAALVLAFYGLSKRFTETIRAEDFTRTQTVAVHSIAYAGYLSRGIILGIIGVSFFVAVIHHQSSAVRNTDKAFDFLGDHVGHAAFVLVALGTICYGVYMFILGLHYDIDADRSR
jgi:hypothetical protein